MNPETLKHTLTIAKYPIALTGAGISVASGLPTFDISWNDIPARKILSREYYYKYPKQFYDFYREILRWNNVQPNAAQRVLAKYGVTIITQNIDGLHQKAGSTEVIELHGNLRQLICEKCNNKYPSEKSTQEVVPVCSCGHNLKPDIILFGDQIYYWEKAKKVAEKCDLLLVIGTSLQVTPANILPTIVRRNNGKVIVINKECENLFNKLL